VDAERTLAVTNAVHDHTLLQRMLEEQFEAHTEHLTRMIMCGDEAFATASDRASVCALSTTSRQALADIAHALRRMAEGSYGACERCGLPIPLARLESLPQARYCVACQPSAQEVCRAQRS
jgi:DnaK suppressor protein